MELCPQTASAPTSSKTEDWLIPLFIYAALTEKPGVIFWQRSAIETKSGLVAISAAATAGDSLL
jgi:hypothetical protein